MTNYISNEAQFLVYALANVETEAVECLHRQLNAIKVILPDLNNLADGIHWPVESSSPQHVFLLVTTNITIGGDPFVVMIDTGRQSKLHSDLWVASTVSSASSTGQDSDSATVSYASGAATGPVMSAPVDFAGYTIPSQAFIQVPPDSSHPAAPGLIGLGPSEGSVVYGEFDSTEGNTVLNNIFLQNTATPNFIIFALSCLDGPGLAWRPRLGPGLSGPGLEIFQAQAQARKQGFKPKAPAQAWA
ncbi:hypothetical protein K438DRAFT_1927392 [Mycena galopus ATCC 62051]|nr:hypothetical protein K438DRAFT_1927392 [Mycena galopus ATCC 62051]